MENDLFIIQKNAKSLFKDKGSKHFGYSYKINSIEEVKEIVADLRKTNSKANHVCYAYRLIQNNRIEEFSTDAGEPSNSAGAPILGQLKSFKVINTLVCVVRYFGGTKLGVSGLINAYKTTAQEVIELSGKQKFERLYFLKLNISDQNLGIVLSFLSKENIEISNQDYSNEYIITVKTNGDELNKIKAKFESLVKLSWEEI